MESSGGTERPGRKHRRVYSESNAKCLTSDPVVETMSINTTNCLQSSIDCMHARPLNCIYINGSIGTKMMPSSQW